MFSYLIDITEYLTFPVYFDEKFILAVVIVTFVINVFMFVSVTTVIVGI